MTLEDIYKEVCTWKFMSPKLIMHHFGCNRYKANKVIKMFRDRGLVKYEIIPPYSCDGSCINEGSPYCECGTPTPPRGIRLLTNPVTTP